MDGPPCFALFLGTIAPGFTFFLGISCFVLVLVVRNELIRTLGEARTLFRFGGIGTRNFFIAEREREELNSCLAAAELKFDPASRLRLVN